LLVLVNNKESLQSLTTEYKSNVVRHQANNAEMFVSVQVSCTTTAGGTK